MYGYVTFSDWLKLEEENYSMPGISKKLLVGLVVALVVLGVAGFILLQRLSSQVTSVELTMWGLWEDPSVYQPVIADFEKLHPNVKITYKKQDALQYKERLNNILANPGAPDIFRMHASWVPSFRNLIAPFPNDVISAAQFQNTFYPVHSHDLVVGGKVLAIPLEVDGLVLFVNVDILNRAALSPATTWPEFEEQVKKLTVRGRDGKIQTAGAALGTSNNVDHWQEILLLLLLQNGANPPAPGSRPAEAALTYYTNFATRFNAWDESVDEPSTLAFAHNRVAYYFGPTWRYFDLKELSKNQKPPLNFKVMPVFQLTSDEKNVATYWAEAVAKQSVHQKEAFDFLKFLSSKESLTKMYTAQTKIRQFGEPYPRVDMKNLITGDQVVGPFITKAEKSKSWYLASFTWDGDNGINSRISKYYADAVNSVGRGGNATNALRTVSDGMSQVLQLGGIAPQQEIERLNY